MDYFNDFISISDFVTRITGLLTNNELESIWKETVVV